MSGALVPRGEEGGIRFVQFAPQPPFDDRLIFWQKRTSDTAAAFRLLRQRLIERGDPRIVLCTSAGRREGKTTLAANLAMAYAELGRHRVLLLEASFRVAALGEVFGFLPPRGFAGQLASHRDAPGGSVGGRSDRHGAPLRHGRGAERLRELRVGDRRGRAVLPDVRQEGGDRRPPDDRRRHVLRGDQEVPPVVRLPHRRRAAGAGQRRGEPDPGRRRTPSCSPRARVAPTPGACAAPSSRWRPPP